MSGRVKGQGRALSRVPSPGLTDAAADRQAVLLRLKVIAVAAAAAVDELSTVPHLAVKVPAGQHGPARTRLSLGPAHVLVGNHTRTHTHNEIITHGRCAALPLLQQWELKYWRKQNDVERHLRKAREGGGNQSGRKEGGKEVIRGREGGEGLEGARIEGRKIIRGRGEEREEGKNESRENEGGGEEIRKVGREEGVTGGQ